MLAATVAIFEALIPSQRCQRSQKLHLKLADGPGPSGMWHRGVLTAMGVGDSGLCWSRCYDRRFLAPEISTRFCRVHHRSFSGGTDRGCSTRGAQVDARLLVVFAAGCEATAKGRCRLSDGLTDTWRERDRWPHALLLSQKPLLLVLGLQNKASSSGAATAATFENM